MGRVWRPNQEVPPPLRQRGGAQFNDLIESRCSQQSSLSKGMNSSSSSSKMRSEASTIMQMRIISKD
jgi:hypothetical protein